jgi:iron(III) transport system ATP-binding protein
MTDLRLDSVSRAFGTFEALSVINLHVKQGEFVSLLGPSGCGKSTTLAIIAGLDSPTSGRVFIGDRLVADGEAGMSVPPEERGLGLVLQSYALWPHMTLRQNVGLPLAIRKVAKKKREALVEEYLALVELGPYAERYPHELSGGQQQRAALARTLVYKPAILLLDEPLSNIDAKLRERARGWLRRLHKTFGLTTIFVTHDQAEALSMSDRVAVMERGRIAQEGSPRELYAHPNSVFVADFIGSSNFLSGVLVERVGDDAGIVMIEGQRVKAVLRDENIPVGGAIVVSVRPENVYAASGDPLPGSNVVNVEIFHGDFLGARTLFHARFGKQTLRFESAGAAPDAHARVAFLPEDGFVFQTEKLQALPNIEEAAV